MLFLLGALAASFLALCITPFVWSRAVRVTEHRIEAAIPLSMQEMQAERDQMRAQHAINIRSVEMQRDKARDKISSARLAVSHQQRKNDAMDIEIASKEAALNNEKLIKSRIQAELNEEKAKTRRLNKELQDTSGESAQRLSDIEALNETQQNLEKEIESDRRELKEAALEIERQRLALMDLEDLVERRERDIARLKGIGFETVSTKKDVVAAVIGTKSPSNGAPSSNKSSNLEIEPQAGQNSISSSIPQMVSANQDEPSQIRPVRPPVLQPVVTQSDLHLSIEQFQDDLSRSDLATLNNDQCEEMRVRMSAIANRLVIASQQINQVQEIHDEISLPMADELTSKLVDEVVDDTSSKVSSDEAHEAENDLDASNAPSSSDKGGLSGRLLALRQRGVAE